MKRKGTDAKSEFVSLMKAAGWSQAETARRLQITPGAVSQICNGKTVPRPAIINLLRLLIAHENPEALKLHDSATQAGLQPWARQLVEALSNLPDKEREQALTPIKAMIAGFQSIARHR